MRIEILHRPLRMTFEMQSLRGTILGARHISIPAVVQPIIIMSNRLMSPPNLLHSVHLSLQTARFRSSETDDKLAPVTFHSLSQLLTFLSLSILSS